MTTENLKKTYEHNRKLVEDKEYRDKFAITINQNGTSVNETRSNLIKDTASQKLKEMERKFTSLFPPKKEESSSNSSAGNSKKGKSGSS